MLRILLFSLLLLAPGIASGATVSTSFPIQITKPSGGGTIACDYGPPYTGSVPQPAANAGFTHCAANFDFSYASSFTNGGNSHQWSNFATWFDCYGASNPLVFNPGGGANNVPCDSNHYNYVNDQGHNVMKLSWHTSDAPGAPPNVFQTHADTSDPNNAWPAYIGFTMPTTYYEETTWRTDNDSACPASGGCLLWGPFQFVANSYPYGQFIEQDYDELYSPNSCCGTHVAPGWGFWGPRQFTSGFSVNPPYDPLNYHTYGWLSTSNGTDIGVCLYQRSGVVYSLSESDFLSCDRETPSDSNSMRARSELSLFWMPNANDVFNGGNPVNGLNISQDFSVYDLRLTVWTCANWRGPSENSNIYTGNQCFGTVDPGH